MRVIGLSDIARNFTGGMRPHPGIVAIFLFVSAVCAGLATPVSAQSYRINTITVQGNSQIDDATVAGFARIARGRTISAAELNAAYQRVASTGFFRSVEFVPSGNRLLIRVEEYPILSRVNIEGNRRINNDTLNAVIVSRPGRVYSPAQAEADANAIAEAYAAQGRLAARVTPRLIERAGGRVDLAFEVIEGGMVELERISFVGNRSFSDRRLRNAIESAQAGLLSVLFRVDNYNEQRIARDRQTLQDFYLSRGYVDAQVLSAITEVTRERDGAYVTFTIREGQQYRFGATSVISEIDGIDAGPYQALLNVRAGALFTPNALENLIQRLERQAYQSGQRFVRAEPRLTRNERDGVINVEFALVRADRVFIERIDVQGNTSTQDAVIRRQFHVAEGDPLNPREIREAASRIRDLGYFADVQTGTRQGSASDQAIVDVLVEETTTGSLGLGASYGANDGLGASITYSEANFLGRGQQVSLSLSTARDSRAFDFSITEPALLGRDLALGLQLGYTITNPTQATRFRTRITRLAPSLSFPVSEYGRLTVRAAVQRDDLRPSTAALTPPISTRIASDFGRATTGSVGYTYAFDTRRNGPNPDRGFVFRFSQDAAGVGRRWLRTTAMVGYEQRILNGDVTLRAEAEAGAVIHRSGASRINERFTLTSDQFRGFRPYGIGPADLDSGDGLGGNYYAVARFESEFPLGLPAEYGMTGGVFLDVGSLWGVDNHGGANIADGRRLRATAGVSLFWRSPLGPLRFNFAVPLRREAHDRVQRFDFVIATRF